jgi:hypothetical protein
LLRIMVRADALAEGLDLDAFEGLQQPTKMLSVPEGG